MEHRASTRSCQPLVDTSLRGRRATLTLTLNFASTTLSLSRLATLRERPFRGIAAIRRHEREIPKFWRERRDSNPKALRLHGSRFFRRTRVTLQPRVADIVAVALRKKRRNGLKSSLIDVSKEPKCIRVEPLRDSILGQVDEKPASRTTDLLPIDSLRLSRRVVNRRLTH